MSSTIEKALQKQKNKGVPKSDEVQKKDENNNKANLNLNDVELQDCTNVDKKEDQTTTILKLNIDLKRLDDNGHVALNQNRSRINEEYREIKRKLLANAFGPLSKTIKNSNIIMVSSGRPSEGKTFTATNLALSIAAERDKTVLLVDADVLKPNVLRTLGLENQTGLMEYLSDECNDLSEVIYQTNVDKLRIIPAGKSHLLSTEFLASEKMRQTVNEFANRYSDRIVIVDTPPLIGINESAILANFAGQAVIVVEESKSKLSDIKLAVERLNPDMAIGFVINKSTQNDTDGTGYYGYYYAQE